MMRNFSQGYKTYEENEELISLKIEDLGGFLLEEDLSINTIILMKLSFKNAKFFFLSAFS